MLNNGLEKLSTSQKNNKLDHLLLDEAKTRFGPSREVNNSVFIYIISN